MIEGVHFHGKKKKKGLGEARRDRGKGKDGKLECDFW